MHILWYEVVIQRIDILILVYICFSWWIQQQGWRFLHRWNRLMAFQRANRRDPLPKFRKGGWWGVPKQTHPLELGLSSSFIGDRTTIRKWILGTNQKINWGWSKKILQNKKRNSTHNGSKDWSIYKPRSGRKQSSYQTINQVYNLCLVLLNRVV